MSELRGALIGCGFFSRNHLHGWREVDGARIVAVCDADASKVRAANDQFGTERAYTDAGEMLAKEKPDFVDIVTGPATHRPLVELVASHRINVICQKPLANSMEDAEAAVEACSRANVRFMVHENFRWQTPMRAVKSAADKIGKPFFGRITFRSGFDVYRNQPYLATDKRFIIADLGVHLLDLARFFMGDVESVYCRTQRVNPNISGEDVATILLGIRGGGSCVVELSYATKPEEELFPQTFVHLEMPNGTVTLGGKFRLTVVDSTGVKHLDAPPKKYDWSTSPAEAIQESVVTIQQHWLNCLRDRREPETSGRDNLKTLGLVYDAYRSAETNQVVRCGEET